MSALSQVTMRRSLHPQTTKQSRNRYLKRGVAIYRDASLCFSIRGASRTHKIQYAFVLVTPQPKTGNSFSDWHFRFSRRLDGNDT